MLGPAPTYPPHTRPDGSPATTNPPLPPAHPRPARNRRPNFFNHKFPNPPFPPPIYQAAGIQYGIRWEILAAINEIETDYGRNLNVSSAGAVGWMQFLPSTWKTWGVDANKDGRKDPFNPVDAIFAAARYLKAAGGDQDIQKAIFAYNHAGWYVDSVMLRARLIAGVPADLVGSLTGLTEGHFPVYAHARYADDLADQATIKRVARGATAANVVERERLFANPTRPDAKQAGGLEQLLIAKAKRGAYATFNGASSRPVKFDPKRMRLARLRKGAHVIGGTLLGRVGPATTTLAPPVYFHLRPAGKGAPLIDPKPILDGWKLLEATSIYRASGRNALYDPSGSDNLSIGQVMLL